jgi:outer membrane protein
MIKACPLLVVSCLLVAAGTTAVHAQAPTDAPPGPVEPQGALPPAERAGSPGRRMSLDEVIRRARDNPPTVLAALATLERNRSEERAAGGGYYPRLNLEANGGLAYENRPYLPGLPRYKSTSLTGSGSATLDYALLDAQRSAGVKAASAQVEAQRALSDEARRAAVEGAVALYFQALAARELVADARLTVERRTAQYDSVAALTRAGVRPPVDEQRAKIEVVIAQTNLQLREVDERALAAGLAAAMGDDPLSPVRPEDAAHEAFPEVHEPAQAVARALESRPDVLAGRAAVRASMARDQTARAARLPTVGIAGSTQLAYVDVLKGQGLQGEAFNGSVGLYLRWAALDATVWRQAEVSGSAVLEAEKNLDATLLRVQSEAVDASYRALRQKVMLEQTEQVLASAQVARTSQNERYRAGVATLLELLDAEQVEQSARLARIEAQREFDIARARLASAVGVIAR